MVRIPFLLASSFSFHSKYSNDDSGNPGTMMNDVAEDSQEVHKNGSPPLIPLPGSHPRDILLFLS